MHRLVNIGLFVSFLFCYLEWGKTNSGFIFQLEWELFSKGDYSKSFLHPAILVPFMGQLLMLVAIFKRMPSKRLTLTGMILVSLLVLLILLAGALSLNAKIILSTLPFLLLSVYFIRFYRKQH